MAIDDNTSYELTGAQVKDLANKIKAKAADNIFVGATSALPGAKGLVPAPQAGDDTKFLSGDGTWAAVQTGGSAVVDFYLDAPLDSIMMGGGSNINVYKDQAKTIAATMKDIYDAALDGGARLNYFYLIGSTVEGARSWMSAGTYYDLDDNWYSTAFTPAGDAFSVLYYIGGGALVTYIDVTNWAAKAVLQPKLTAGSNISITTSGATNTISATDTTYSDFTGATSSVAGAHGLVPAPAAGDESKVLLGDGTWGDATAKLVEMSYGESNAWAKFIAAYQAGSIVYCRASSNANPGSGSQTRKAFMAYVNNASNPTSVEFQYVRSNSSKSDSNQCDQVFVYTLTNSNGGTWSVASRDMAPKILVDSTLNKTFSGGANASVTLGAKAMTGATGSAAGKAGYVPAPAAGDQNKFLKGDGTWTDLAGSYSTSEVATPYTWVDGKTIYKQTFVTSNITQTQFYVTHGISNFGALVKAEGVMYTANQGYQPLDRVLPSLMSTWGWGLGDVGDTTFALFFGSGYVLSQITTWITLYYTKSS